MSKGEIIPEQAVRFERILPGTPQKVWAFLTENARLPEWHGEGAIEPREGGKVWLMGGHIRGVVTGWRPDSFLAYTWSVFDPADPPDAVSAFPLSYLEFTLAPHADAVRLVLVHRPIPPDFHQRTAMGWHTMLDLLEAGLSGQALKRADVFPRNAALYGVDINALKR